MHEGARADSLTYSALTAGVGARSHVTIAPQRSPHMFPQRGIGPCTRHRSAVSPPVTTARWAIAACNAARYSDA